MKCKKCGSDNVQIQTVSEQKKRGCIAGMMWILLAICTFGAIIWLPLICKKGSKTVTYAVCQDCGKRWKV